jgi:hypothetical protein
MPGFLFPGIITSNFGPTFQTSDGGATTEGNPTQDNGGNFNDPGVWTLLPEPSTAVLLAAGLGSFSLVRQRNRPLRKSSAPAPR